MTIVHGEWPEEVIRKNAQRIRDIVDKEILEELRKLSEKQLKNGGYPIKINKE
jgi:restriction endonuclease Mrr